MNGSNVLSSIAKRAAVALLSSNLSIRQSPTLPLYTFYMFYTAKPLCALCASALKSPNPSISQSPTLPLPYLFAIPPIQERDCLEMPVRRIEDSPAGHCLCCNPDVVCRNHSSFFSQLVEYAGIIPPCGLVWLVNHCSWFCQKFLYQFAFTLCRSAASFDSGQDLCVCGERYYQIPRIHHRPADFTACPLEKANDRARIENDYRIHFHISSSIVRISPI